MKKVLITGSNGFVGQNLISSLSNKFDLYGLDRHQTRNLPKSNYYIGDLGDLNLLKKVFEEIKPDVLIHLAAIVHKNNADTSEKNYNFLNFECSNQLFDLCEKYRTHVIFSSTIEVYGETEERIINENSKCNPNSYYAKSKLKAEEYLKSLNLKYSILRFTPLYGKNFTLNIDKRVFLKKNKIAYYFKDGQYSFDFCSINNVCDFIVNLIDKYEKNDIYVLSDSNTMTVKEIIQMHKKNGNCKIIVKMPYYFCEYTILIIEKILTFMTKKDVFLSKRNFKKLFASKKYEDTKLKNVKFKWNIENTIYGEHYE